MTCREAERLVMPYINGSITDEELKSSPRMILMCGLPEELGESNACW